MRISQQSVITFAGWSGDSNPIHVDAIAAKSSAFGGTIVHGALSTIEALREARRSPATPAAIELIEITFRDEVRPDRDYHVEATQKNGSLSVRVLDGLHTQLSISADAVAPDDNLTTCSPTTCMHTALRR